MTEFTDAQETKIAEIAEQKSAAAIAGWQAARPRWWQLRKRLDVAVAGLGIVSILAAAGADAVLGGWSYFPAAMHWAAGTDARIEAQIEGAAKAWSRNADSLTTDALNMAFTTKLDQWADDGKFSAMSRSALQALATASDAENPLRAFVHQALDDNPILMFHGQGVLGSDLPVDVKNIGCKSLLQRLHKLRVEVSAAQAAAAGTGVPIASIDEIGVTQIEAEAGADAANDQAEGPDATLLDCQIVANVREQRSLDVPFFARFHPDDTGVVDRVLVVLQVRRFSVEAPTVIAANDKPDNSNIGVNALNGELAGLSIAYNSTDELLQRQGTDAVDISSALKRFDGNFFVGYIDELIKTKMAPPTIGHERAFNVIHSISVALPEAEAGAPEEIVQVRALVLINKNLL